MAPRLMFHSVKHSIVLKQPDAKAKLLKLMSKADVLVERLRPGVLATIAGSPEELLKRFPELLTCSTSGYGQTSINGSHTFWT